MSTRWQVEDSEYLSEAMCQLFSFAALDEKTDLVQSRTFWTDKAMATYSSVLAWRINPRDGGAWWAAVYRVAQSRR